MSRRSSRVAKRGRAPLVEVDANVVAAEDEKQDEKQAPPDIGLLNLSDAALHSPAASDADESQPSPPKQRKKRGKYHLRLTYDQRTEIVHQWISGWKAPTIIQDFARKGVTIPKSNIDNIIRTHRQEGRISLKPHHHRQHKYTPMDRATMATLQIENNKWTYEQIRQEWRRHSADCYNR